MSRLAAALGLLLVACTPSTSTTQRLAIGAACATSGQCGTGAFYCEVGWPSGYCKEQCGSDGDCPRGSLCAGAGLLTSGACLSLCAAGGDCRAGYRCMPDGSAARSYCAAPPVDDLAGVDRTTLD